MNPPIKKGARVIVYGNLEAYATAIVVDCSYQQSESRWAIVLEWPNAPGGPGYSRVYDTDEGKGWYRYAASN